MKNFFILAALVLSSQAFAKADIVCSVNNKPVSLTSKYGYQCLSSILYGTACFTGNRTDVIKLLNSSAFQYLIPEVDAHYIENVRASGANNITYMSVNDPEETQFKVTISPCKF